MAYVETSSTQQAAEILEDETLAEEVSVSTYRMRERRDVIDNRGVEG